MPLDVRQYDSAIDFISDDTKFRKLIANLSNNDDRMRLKAYDLYEAMYHNRPEHIRVTLRSDDDDSVQIYVPSAKKCIEAIHRFLGVKFQIIPDQSVGSPPPTPELNQFLIKLFKREKFKSKFTQLKRYMLIKGDSLLHITASPWKDEGERLSIVELKPEHYFPIEDLVSGDLIGCHIVDIINNPNSTTKLRAYTGKQLVRRQTYRKVLDENDNPTGAITSELGLYEIGKWDDRPVDYEISLIETLVQEFQLPAQIKQLPVYHWRNNPLPGSSFGLSELAGVESIVTAINQATSDEDLTLLTQGLGVYWTDASPPMNSRGEEVEWDIGPMSVVQVASGGQFGRVSGITTVTPYTEHIQAIDEAMQQALGVPDIAIGQVDVATAESGIALQLKLGPLLAHNAEKEVDILDTTDQFLYDLINGWIPAYEDIDSGGISLVMTFGDAMPENKSKDVQDVMSIWTGAPNTLPVGWLYDSLNKIMGYQLSPNDYQQALSDAAALMDAQQPPMQPATNGQVGAGV